MSNNNQAPMVCVPVELIARMLDEGAPAILYRQELAAILRECAAPAPQPVQGEAVAWPWLAPLGALVSAAKDRDLSREAHEAEVNAAHSKLFDVLRSTSATQPPAPAVGDGTHDGDSPEDHACFIEACADTFASTGRPITARTLREAADLLRKLATPAVQIAAPGDVEARAQKILKTVDAASLLLMAFGRDGLLCADKLNAVRPAIDAALRSQGQADAVVGEIRLWDSQWVNVVNHDNCYRDWEQDRAIAHAVRMTEDFMRKNYAEGKWPPAKTTAALAQQANKDAPKASA